jgi:MFS family permease
MDIHIVIASFIFLYTMGVFNPSQLNISASLDWGDNESLFITLFSSFVPVGALVGTTITGYLIDRFGRRKTVMWNDWVYILGTIILVMPSTATFGIGRLITGCSAGIFMTIGPIYVTEVTPEAMMGKVGPIIVIANNLGLLVAYGLGLALPTGNFKDDPFNYWWLIMYLFPAALCLYQFFYFKFFCKFDTPQFYMAQNMTREASQALGLTYTNQGMEGGLRRLNSEIKGKFGVGQKPTILSLFTAPRFRKMMRIGSLLCILNQLSGMAAIIFYSTLIFGKLGGGVFLSRLLTFIMGIVNLISAFFSILLLGWFGRKTLIVSGHFLICVDLVLLGVFSGYADGGVEAPAIFVIIFFLFFTYSLAATLWMYVAEVLNDQVLSVCCIMNMSTTVLITFIFPTAVDSVGINNSFLFFAFCMFFGGIYCWVDLVETKGKDKEQILISMNALQAQIRPEEQENDSLQQESDKENQKKENNVQVKDPQTIGVGMDLTTTNKADLEA